MNIGTLLPRHERYRGGHPALVIGGRTLSYRELNAYVNRFANALLAANGRRVRLIRDCVTRFIAQLPLTRLTGSRRAGI
jgi:acyl-CoA synthetase (AMP-forming)/AMP-acid ligase II